MIDEVWDEYKHLNIFLIGTGLIGRTLIKQIEAAAPKLEKEARVMVKILGMADSKKMVFDNMGVEFNKWRERLTYAEDQSDLEKFVEKAEEMQMSDINVYSEGVLIDCTASEEVPEIYYGAMEAGLHVVTPNKKAASGDMDYYRDLLEVAEDSEVNYLYETNVGAGLPVISTLHDLVNTGDEIVRLEAILSGTLSYIFNTFSTGDKFSKVVEGAMDKGYTEPDPRDDLNGMDVARKILILARETGLEMDLQDVEVESLIPKGPAEKASNVIEFFKELRKSDEDFAKRADEAAKEDKVLRYIAKLEKGKASVKLEAVGKDHPFYNMAGSDNIISFTTKRYCETPLVIKGPGAGAEVTAAGVFADALRVIV